MIIKCPYCGDRYLSEFSYEGDANLKRPDENNYNNNKDWYDYVYARKNDKDNHLELWQHVQGCRQFVVVDRNLQNHNINAVFSISDWHEKEKKY